jgi:hypothetical protein
MHNFVCTVHDLRNIDQIKSNCVRFRLHFDFEWDSSVRIATGHGLGGRGYIPGRGKIFLFSTVSMPVLGPIQPPIQRLPGDFPLGAKQLECEANHILPSSAKVKNGGAVPPLLHMSSWHSAKFIKHRDNCTFLYLQWI